MKSQLARQLMVGLVLTVWARVSHATLVGYWNFNEGTGQLVADSSGFGNTGTLGATTSVEATDPTWVAGRSGAGTALSFASASSQKVTVNDPGSSSLDIGSAGLNDAMTISVWVKPNLNNANQHVVTKTSNNFPGNYELWYMSGPNATTQSFYYNATPSGSAFLGTSVGAGVVPAAGSWVNETLVAQEDGAGNTSVKWYMNGVQVGTTQTSALNLALANNAALTIGIRGDGNSPFDGLIDDVAIWNHALNPAQLAQLGADTRSVLDIVPEPSTVLLLGVGAGLVWRRRRHVS